MLRININGIVQGVGFRPFIYKLAHDMMIRGYVLNSTAGVEIIAQAKPEILEKFIYRIKNEHPPGAFINDLRSIQLPDKKLDKFIIKKSKDSNGTTLISPDLAICKDCINEMFDPGDHRFNYPFINCTNCGPRYTIIHSLPYDRPNTSMQSFPLCNYCHKEYIDPLNRRFHAQPVACDTCGPQLFFLNKKLQLLAGDPIKNTISHLKNGKIIGIKGIGGFHLACDATNETAVKLLRERKNRAYKPFAVMCYPDKVHQLVYISNNQFNTLQSSAAPIMILRKKSDHPLADSTSPLNPNLGIFFPYAPHHFQIISKDLPFLVMTSGNIFNEPIAADESELGGICDYILTHNRPILNRCDDSILLPSDQGNVIIRRSRGYIPSPIDLNIENIPTLGCGAGLKITFSLSNKNRLFLSTYIGNDSNKRTFDFYTETIEKYKHWFKIEPELYACDLQPDFLTTRYAEDQGKPLIRVQHHHAHIAAVMAEHRISEPVIGIAYDGTGLGDDNAIWGGEIFIADLSSYQRIYHLNYMPLPGGDAAIRHPIRIAYAYALKAGIDPEEIIKIDKLEKQVIKKQIENNFNVFNTSSIGRLFDCVSAMLGLFPTISFEAQSALALQFLCGNKNINHSGYYNFSLEKDQINIIPLIKEIARDIHNKISHEKIAMKFHNTIVEFTLASLLKIRKFSDIRKVVLSGGVMQNQLILDCITEKLEKNSFTVIRPVNIPLNDGSISVGQVVIANNIIKR